MDTPSISRPRPDNVTKDAMEKENLKEEALKKNPYTSQEASGKAVEKVCPPFNFEHEMDKIKISISFNENVENGRDPRYFEYPRQSPCYPIWFAH
jgi:hypothetical protein